jgi:tetratricopeptide (TPR) repeat protein
MSWIRRHRWMVPVAFLGLMTAAGIALFRQNPRAGPSGRSFDDLLQQARSDYSAGRYSASESAARDALEIVPDSSDALLVAAEAATKQKHLEDALAYYRRVSQNAGQNADSALYGAAEILIHVGRLSDAERNLRRVLRRDAGHLQATFRLAYLLGITGRNWEAVPYGVALIRRDAISPERLLLLGDVERFFDASDHMRKCRAARSAAIAGPGPRRS